MGRLWSGKNRKRTKAGANDDLLWVSKILSETASRYVMGDKVRKPRQPVKYKLNRKGLKYIKGVITGNNNEW